MGVTVQQQLSRGKASPPDLFRSDLQLYLSHAPSAPLNSQHLLMRWYFITNPSERDICHSCNYLPVNRYVDYMKEWHTFRRICFKTSVSFHFMIPFKIQPIIACRPPKCPLSSHKFYREIAKNRKSAWSGLLKIKQSLWASRYIVCLYLIVLCNCFITVFLLQNVCLLAR